jgi:3-methylcrotonyl-CoA carboxylase beta subunit
VSNGLLDPGAPFLEIGQLAANGMYERRCARAALITGIGRVSGRECMIVVQRRDGEGRHLLIR